MESLKRKFVCLIGLIIIAFLFSSSFKYVPKEEKRIVGIEEKGEKDVLICENREEAFVDELSSLLEQPQNDSCLFVGCGGFF